MESFGEIIRKLRQEKKLPLREVAAFLDIEKAMEIMSGDEYIEITPKSVRLRKKVLRK